MVSEKTKVYGLGLFFCVWLILSYLVATALIRDQDALGKAIYGFYSFYFLMIIGAVFLGGAAVFIAVRNWTELSLITKSVSWLILLSPVLVAIYIFIFSLLHPQQFKYLH